MQLATLCYVRRGSQTLMLQRNKKVNDIHAGKWNGLGGKFEAGETPEDCVIREVFEESGLRIERPQLHGILTFPEFKDGEDWRVFVFSAQSTAGDCIESGEGTLQWIDTAELSALPLWEGDSYFLPWIAEGRFFSAKFVYVNKQLVSHDVTFHFE